MGTMRAKVSILGVVFGMVVGLALLVTAATAAAGQEIDRRRGSLPGYYLDLNLLGANPTGEFGQLVNAGFGGQLGLRIRMGDRSPVFLRLDAGGMIYGLERWDVCFGGPIGCRIGAQLNTTNTVGYMGVGPELVFPGSVSPYVFGGVGFSYFSTQSSLQDFDGFNDSFNTRHFADFVWASRLGGGMRFGSGRVKLDVGAEYHRNGVAEYLREGDILDNPDGSITVFPNRSEANFMTYRLGVSIGLGGGR
jgi:hypothetical protein